MASDAKNASAKHFESRFKMFGTKEAVGIGAALRRTAKLLYSPEEAAARRSTQTSATSLTRWPCP
jgi:hypothetical protein